MADPTWETVLLGNAPPALVAFVRDLKLPTHYVYALDDLGYDDVDDLANLDAAAIAKLRSDLESKNFKPPHVDKIVRAIDGRRGPQPPAGMAAATTPTSAPASSSFPHPAGAATPQRAVHLSADGIVQIAAHDVGAIAAQKQREAHVARVMSHIEDRKKVHPAAPRLLYGLNSPACRSDYEVQMNAAALSLLEENPLLVLWSDGRWKTQPLIEAAKEKVKDSGFGFAKGHSKAAGAVASPAVGGKAVGGKAVLPSPVPGLKAATLRMSAAVRTSEMELLPTQIIDLQGKLDTMRAKRSALLKRGEQSDLQEAHDLGNEIETKQRAVSVPRSSPSPPLPTCLFDDAFHHHHGVQGP